MEYRRRNLQSFYEEEEQPQIRGEHRVPIYTSLDDQIEAQMNYLYHHPLYVVKVALSLFAVVFVLYYSKKIILYTI